MESRNSETRRPYKLINTNFNTLFEIGLLDKFRPVERVIKKLTTLKWRLVFLRACLSEYLMPKFAINIYIIHRCLSNVVLYVPF